MKHLPEFFDKLKTALETERPGLVVLFGTEHLYRKDNISTFTANRVVVAPHDKSGSTGSFLAPMQVHRAPRDVGIDRQNVLIETWSYDGADGTDRKKTFETLATLRHVAFRNTQAIVRANYHVTPKGEIPGFLQGTRETMPAPTERVHGMKEQWIFWIDFSVRNLSPTELGDPELETTITLETP